MSVISNFPVMPNRIMAVAEYLLGLGADGGDLDQIQGQLSPLTKAQDDAEEKGSVMAEYVLREMKSLGMLVRCEAGTFALCDELLEAGKSGHLEQAVRAYLFATMTDPACARTRGQDEVPDALAWLLAQDPFKPLSWKGEHAQRLKDQLDEGDDLRKLAGNDQLFQNLVYWSRYLGFAQRIGNDAIVPDPTEVVGSTLPSVFGGEKEITIEAFVQRLGRAISVLDGGHARQQLEARMRDNYLRPDKTLSRSLSLALTRLELRGLLKLNKPSDAHISLLDLGKESKPISHVMYCEHDKEAA
jgi:hypothetical protein